jgi:hypothetical protein
MMVTRCFTAGFLPVLKKNGHAPLQSTPIAACRGVRLRSAAYVGLLLYYLTIGSS